MRHFITFDIIVLRLVFSHIALVANTSSLMGVDDVQGGVVHATLPTLNQDHPTAMSAPPKLF